MITKKPNTRRCGCVRYFGKWILCPAHEEDLFRVHQIEEKEYEAKIRKLTRKR